MIYQNIKAIANEKKIPISEIERDCDITPKYICTWDTVMPGADKLARVAKRLDTTVEELIGD